MAVYSYTSSAFHQCILIQFHGMTTSFYEGWGSGRGGFIRDGEVEGEVLYDQC